MYAFHKFYKHCPHPKNSWLQSCSTLIQRRKKPHVLGLAVGKKNHTWEVLHFLGGIAKKKMSPLGKGLFETPIGDQYRFYITQNPQASWQNDNYHFIHTYLYNELYKLQFQHLESFHWYYGSFAPFLI